MSLLLICPNRDPSAWLKAFRSIAPDIDVRVWPETGPASEVDFALVWNHPPGLLTEYPNLRAISSMGAGVDRLLDDPQIPVHLPIARIVDPALVQSMGEYIAGAVLQHFRDFGRYREHQQARRWHPEPPRRIGDVTVCIMGIGELGSDVAAKLHAIGFRVAGWSRTPKSCPTLARSYAGGEQLSAFLATASILICLLPLTPETRGILNRTTLMALPQGAYLINVARGGHVVESDLIGVLDSGHLAGACLDVFEQEPLPETHPFWTHPRIAITPHIASITDPRSAAAQVVENYRRAQNGQPLLHGVDSSRGY